MARNIFRFEQNTMSCVFPCRPPQARHSVVTMYQHQTTPSSPAAVADVENRAKKTRQPPGPIEPQTAHPSSHADLPPPLLQTSLCCSATHQQRESTPLIQFARSSMNGSNDTEIGRIGGYPIQAGSVEAEVPAAARRNANVRMNVVDDGVRGMNASRFGLLLLTLVSWLGLRNIFATRRSSSG